MAGIDISKFTAAGVYTIYVDSTETAPTANSPILRLLVGFSKRGPANVPVFIDANDVKMAKAIFGERDTALERNGSFFHKMLFDMLEEGPVLALNLLNLNNETVDGLPTENADVTPYRSYSLDIASPNGIVRSKLFSSYFNKERTWNPDRNYLLATRNIVDQKSLLNFVNLSQSPASIIIKKSDVRGFDLTVKEWYAEEGKPVPPFLREDDYVSDYFIDVVVLEGNYGPDKYQQLAIDPLMGNYFDNNGLQIAKLDEFLARPEVNIRNIFTGTIIPKFRDKENTPRFIEDQINRSTRQTGIMCAVDVKELDRFENETNVKFIDLVGHRLLTENVETADFLSYKNRVNEDFLYQKDTDNDLVISSIQNMGAAVLGVDETISEGSFKLDTGVSGSVDSVTVNGVQLLASPIPFNTSLAQTASDVANYIFSNPSTPDYTATALGAVVTIQAAIGVGAGPNGFVVAVTGTGITFTNIENMGVTTLGVDEIPSQGSLTLSAGTNGSINSIKVAGVEIMSGSVPFNTSLNQTVIDLAANINGYTSSPNYTATALSGVLRIVAEAGLGSFPNGLVVTASTSLYDEVLATTGVTITPRVGGPFTVSITSANPQFALLTAKLAVGDLISGETTAQGTLQGILIASPVLEISRVLKTVSQITFDCSTPLKENETSTSGSFVDIYINADNQFEFLFGSERFLLDGTQTYYVADIGSQIYQDWKSGTITNGDKINNGTADRYLKFTEMRDQNGLFSDDFRRILKIELFTDSDLTIPISTGTAIDFGDSFDSKGYPVLGANDLVVISFDGTFNRRFDATIISPKIVRIPIANEPEILSSHYLVGLNSENEPFLTRIKSIKRFGTPTPTHIDVETENVIKIFTSLTGSNQIERFVPFESFFKYFDPTYLSGFKLKASHMPDGTNERMNEILSVITNTNLFSALTDPDMVEFRYIVDSFSQGLETNSKRLYSRIASVKQTCLGLLNTPAFQEFIDSENPRFTDSPTPSDPVPTLNVRYIRDGGNLAENPDFLYTLPEKQDGADFVGFFGPNLKFRDGDDDIFVPPAGLVSNNFMRKFNSGSNPFSAVAGPRRGVLTATNLTGVEYALTRDDRGFLEQKGINPIIQKKSGSIQIYGNETAFKKFKSALNSIHVRDLLISIQLEMERILENYTFEFNDDAIRNEVVNVVDNFLSTLQNGFGVLESYEIIFDRSNNPSSIITENAGLIDVRVEPKYVLKKFINRITLFNQGGTSFGGFVAV